MANLFLNPAANQGNDSEPATFSWTDATQKYSYLALVGFSALLIYSYQNMFSITAGFWEQPSYSHGWIIPLIALYIMWSRRPNPSAQEPARGVQEESFLGLMPCSNLKPVMGVAAVALIGGLILENSVLQYLSLIVLCVVALAYIMVGQPFQKVSDLERWGGVGILLVALSVRTFYAAPIHMEPVNRLTFIAAILGLFLMVGGWHLIKWAGPSLGFLLFMYPLPTAIERPLLGNLQTIAAMASETVLVILGLPVVREGNNIMVDGMSLAVAEACSGLRMVTIFGAMALAMVLLAKRPWWDRLIILLSAIPIALLVNVIRIVMTAVLLPLIPDKAIQGIIHDWAGFAMMPLAMGLLYLELKFLSSLSVPMESLTESRAGMGAFSAK